ncbi:unnamed protein product [Amoebophrya sp. A120]|nr:unnamed protein product [Amoebophrya sp. A120]|eukprot:GSA120T00009651001.1
MLSKRFPDGAAGASSSSKNKKQRSAAGYVVASVAAGATVAAALLSTSPGIFGIGAEAVSVVETPVTDNYGDHDWEVVRDPGWEMVPDPYRMPGNLPYLGKHVVVVSPDMEGLQAELDNIFSENTPRLQWPQDAQWKSWNFPVQNDPQYHSGIPGLLLDAGYQVEGATDPAECEPGARWNPPLACSKIYNNPNHPGQHRGRHFDRSEQSRVQVFFLPGEYKDITIRPGYYHAYSGLGEDIADPNQRASIAKVLITNGSEPNYGEGGLNNFWRSVENFHVTGDVTAAVSQAAPLRRLLVDGSLKLAAMLKPDGRDDPDTPTMGRTSGGHMQDVTVKNTILLGSQQQFCLVDTKAEQYTDGAWSFVGVNAQGDISKVSQNAAKTVISQDQKPVTASKPFLIVRKKPDGSGDFEYWLKVPGFTNHQRLLSNSAKNDDASVQDEVFGPITAAQNSLVYIAFPNAPGASYDERKKSTDKIRSALQKGQHVLLTPGIYSLTDALEFKKDMDGQVLLGLGFVTLEVERETESAPVFPAIRVPGSATRPNIAAITLQPGKNSVLKDAAGKPSVLLHLERVERSYKATDYAILSDVFTRVGGDNSVKTDGNNREVDTMVQVDRDQVVMMDLWLWRADHDVDGPVGEGDTKANRVNTAIRVNGRKVVAYGLAAEHVMQNHVEWNGDDGFVAFYQSELPYDFTKDWGFSPNQYDTSPSEDGWSLVQAKAQYYGYKVTGENHQAHGVGVYMYPRDNVVTVAAGFSVPDSATIENAFTVFLNGKLGSKILNVIENSKNLCPGSDTPVSDPKAGAPRFCRKPKNGDPQLPNKQSRKIPKKSSKTVKNTSTSKKWQQAENCPGSDLEEFKKCWYPWTKEFGGDPTAGTVDYPAGSSQYYFDQLVTKDEGGADGKPRISIDFHKGAIDNSKATFWDQRPAIRMHTKKAFGAGSLFLVDVEQIPVLDGAWPGIWTAHAGGAPGISGWPASGEFDMVEHVNGTGMKGMRTTLHTQADDPQHTCIMKKEDMGPMQDELDLLQSGNRVASNNCQGSDGCGVDAGRAGIPNGVSLNKQRGGIQLMALEEDRAAFFWIPRTDADQITPAQKDDGAFWETKLNLEYQKSDDPNVVNAYAIFSLADTNCSARQLFKSQTLILNTTFCGVWAGKVLYPSQTVWESWEWCNKLVRDAQYGLPEQVDPNTGKPVWNDPKTGKPIAGLATNFLFNDIKIFSKDGRSTNWKENIPFNMVKKARNLLRRANKNVARASAKVKKAKRSARRSNTKARQLKVQKAKGSLRRSKARRLQTKKAIETTRSQLRQAQRSLEALQLNP